MRYLLRKEQRSELLPRCQYLFDVFKLWFVPTGEIDSFIILESFPFVKDDLLLIYGHNSDVSGYFRRHATDVKEKNIAIISCRLEISAYNYLNNKSIYLAPQTKGMAKLLFGEEYGFEFDITDAELQLYNCRVYDPIQKVSTVFEKIR